MSIERVIESIGLSATELKRYLLDEIEEFLDAATPTAKEEEFGDVLFALRAMGWAHAGQHLALHESRFEAKIEQRLRQYATLSRQQPRYLDEPIREMQFGVLHFAFGQFEGPWQRFDALKNGTVAEISLLTDAPFGRPGTLTNHCILTFGDCDTLEYKIIHASPDIRSGNTVLCRMPDFMFKRAKRELLFKEFAKYLSLQTLAAIDGLTFDPGVIAHFHSWENGFLLESEEFRAYMARVKTIFSPYLTTGRLKAVVDGAEDAGWTMTRQELETAAHYERQLSAACMRVVLESARDRAFYGTWVHSDRLDVRSFAGERSAAFSTAPSRETHLHFIAGGRPVREKGFLELCCQFGALRDWAAARGVTISLSILCRERRADKGAAYIAELQRAIRERDLEGLVELEPKVSLEQLRARIAESTAVIAPSLYDPFCLMPTYAVESRRPAFVSLHAGVSENIKSRQFIFDPAVDGDLTRVISSWYDTRPTFEYEARFPSYHDLYLNKEVPEPWA